MDRLGFIDGHHTDSSSMAADDLTVSYKNRNKFSKPRLFKLKRLHVILTTSLLIFLIRPCHAVDANEDHEGNAWTNANFPSPVLQNVLHAWKPVDYGNPLSDATMFYAPPSLERVKFSKQDHEELTYQGKRPESRSLDDGEVLAGSESQRSYANQRPEVVILAEPSKPKVHQGYSIYGSPDINYSARYDMDDPPKLPIHDEQLPDGRESLSRLNFHRSNYNSAVRSRSADSFDNRPREALEALLAGSKAKRKSQGGGIRYIEPPNRQQNDYFYYQPEVTHYRKKLTPKEERKELTRLLARGEKKRPTKVNYNVHNLDFGERVDTERTYDFYNGNDNDHHKNEILTIQDLVGKDSIRTYSKYPSRPPKTSSNSLVRNPAPPKNRKPLPDDGEPSEAVLYSFTNEHGQKQKVGVIYQPPKHSNIFGALQGGTRGSQSVPLKQDPSPRARKKVYPLGTPFNPYAGKSRPDFFPPQPRPPIYKTRPQKLEGVFGPSFPREPEPSRVNLRPVIRQTYQSNSPLTYGRSDAKFKPLPDHNGQEYEVYTFRDMEYQRPKTILHVKDSGELFKPPPGADMVPNYDLTPRVTIRPGHGTLEEQLREKATTTTAPTTTTTHPKTTVTTTEPSTTSVTISAPSTTPKKRTPWRHDFSDMEDKAKDSPPKRSASEEEIQPRSQPLDLVAEPSEVVFRDQVQPSSSGKLVFPDGSNRRPNRDIASLSQGQSIGILTPNEHGIPKLKLNLRRGNSKRRKNTTPKPNYKVVIGLNYDDLEDKTIVQKETDFADPDEDGYEYSPGELYQLCILEVPDYLRDQLCQSLLEGKAGGIVPKKSSNRRSDIRINPRNKARKVNPEPTAVSGVALTPHSSNLFHDKDIEIEESNVIDYNLPESNNVLYLNDQWALQGIPSELPVQGQGMPIITSGLAKVKVYKPSFNTKNTTTTITTTTTTTTRPKTVPETTERPQNKRPLLFNKRNRLTGEMKVSQPFEYFKTLAQYVGGRLRRGLGRPSSRKRPSRPSLVRKRIQPIQR